VDLYLRRLFHKRHPDIDIESAMTAGYCSSEL